MERRSNCPLSCTLELVGDKWSLLIIRDILYFEKTTYNDLVNCPEKIATNILNDRLIKLTNMGLLSYSGSSKRKKYFLTEKGLDLKPVINSIVMFGIKHFQGSKEYLEDQLIINKG